QNSVGAVVTDQGVQLQDVSCEVDWLGVGTVDNTWNQVCATQTTCGTLAEFVTCLSFNYRTLCHVFLLQENCRKYLFQVNSVGRRALAKRKKPANESRQGRVIAGKCILIASITDLSSPDTNQATGRLKPSPRRA